MRVFYTTYAMYLNYNYVYVHIFYIVLFKMLSLLSKTKCQKKPDFKILDYIEKKMIYLTGNV